MKINLYVICLKDSFRIRINSFITPHGPNMLHVSVKTTTGEIIERSVKKPLIENK